MDVSDHTAGTAGQQATWQSRVSRGVKWNFARKRNLSSWNLEVEKGVHTVLLLVVGGVHTVLLLVVGRLRAFALDDQAVLPSKLWLVVLGQLLRRDC